MTMATTVTTSRFRLVVIQAWLPILLVGVWWFASAVVQSPFFPPLSQIMTQFVEVWLGPGFTRDIVPSMSNLFLGFAIALVLGIGIGVAIALLPLVEIVVNPFLQFLRAMPGIALLPVILMIMGTSDASKIALIAYGSLWPILLNSVDGVKAIAPEVRQAAKSYRFTTPRVLFDVLLPGAFPQISVGIRLSLSIALVLMIGSEFFGATRGIGYFVLEAKQQFHIADMWAGVILLGIIGYLLSTGYGLLENRLLRWREVSR